MENSNVGNRLKRGIFFSRTIQRQILIPFLIIIMVSGAIVATVSYTFSVKTTTDELTKNVDVIQIQTKSVEETDTIFNDISSTIKINNEMIDKVINLTEMIAEQEKVLTDNTNHNAMISQETAAGTEEVSASVEEQTASMEILSGLANEFESYSQQMQEEIKKFAT